MTQNQDRIQMTQNGLAEVKQDYQELLELKRPIIVERLSEARREGDLSENNEYIQAKQELAFIDGKIAELEEVISKAVVVNDSHDHCQQISLGCRVTVKNGSGKEQVFCLVGEWEADPSVQKISAESPLGKSLMGRRLGEEVEFEAPAGKILYKITKID